MKALREFSRRSLRQFVASRDSPKKVRRANPFGFYRLPVLLRYSTRCPLNKLQHSGQSLRGKESLRYASHGDDPM